MAQSPDRGNWLSSATVIFLCLSLLASAVRLWVTVGKKQSWSPSEFGVVGAVGFVILHVAVNFWAVSKGYGRPLADIPESNVSEVEKALFVGQISYIAATGLTRVSTAFFISQLTRHAPQIRMSYILAGVAGGWTIIFILIVAFRGDLARPWVVLDGAPILFYRWIAGEVLGLLVEIALWLHSMSLVWGLQMKLRKRILILTVFACRLLLIPIIALRLKYLSPSENYDPTVTNITPHIITEPAMNYALIATCITSLKPFLKPFHSGAIVNTVGGAASGLSGSHAAAQGIYLLTSLSNDPKGTSRTATTTMGGSEDGDCTVTSRTKIYTGKSNSKLTTIVSGPENGEGNGVTHGDDGRMLIQRTMEWETHSARLDVSC